MELRKFKYSWLVSIDDTYDVFMYMDELNLWLERNHIAHHRSQGGAFINIWTNDVQEAGKINSRLDEVPYGKWIK